MGGSAFENSGRRHSAADLLGLGRFPNLQVAVHANVERILLATTSASDN
jgi:mandelonitrile lyase